MGRYYSGDIEGKFWFAIQASNAADRFGVLGAIPEHITYSFKKEDLENVESELKTIKSAIGEKTMELLNSFFNKKVEKGYNDKILEKHGIPKELWNKHKKNYADYGLGIKIRDCIIANDECLFLAEP